MNKIIIHGRLTRNPETKTYSTAKGEPGSLASFSVAVNRRFGEETDFFNCTAFGKTGELVSNHFSKGQEIIVEGSMQASKKEDKTYWNLNVDSFDFCGSKKDNGTPSITDGAEVIDDEDIPF